LFRHEDPSAQSLRVATNFDGEENALLEKHTLLKPIYFLTRRVHSSCWGNRLERRQGRV
jgi:hypothetical protein